MNQITFREYKELVYIPPVLSKAINSYEIAVKKYENKINQDMMDEEFEEQYKLSSEKNKISALLQSYRLSEMINPNIFTYYRVCLTYYALKVSFVILLPVDYPSKYWSANSRSPEIKILSFDRNEEKGKEVKAPAGIPMKAQFDVKNTFCQEAEELEIEANSNSGWESPMKGKIEKNFSLLLRINRIITVIGRLQNNYHEAHKKYDWVKLQIFTIIEISFSCLFCFFVWE